MVIPRENNMVRLYIQLASSTDPNFNPRQSATAEEVQEKAKKILAPYSISWDHVDWYSVYPIGQGIAARYTLDERVFMGGDCCHTHSPKAGQGMNTAFLDAQNLAWKIHHVESGFADRSILKTYESERKSVAENLLNFDNKYAALFSQRKPSADEITKHTGSKDNTSSAGPTNPFIELFKSSCEFTSGYGVAYGPGAYNFSPSHPAASSPVSSLFYSPANHTTTLTTGRILLPATVTRIIDANVVHLENEVPVNGSFRIYIFAGTPSPATTARLRDFAAALSRKGSWFNAFLRPDRANVSYHEKHNPDSLAYTICTILACGRTDIEIADLPPVLARYADHVYADNVSDSRVPGARASAHAKMGLSEEKGGVVVVRPDGYVGAVVGLEGAETVEAMNEYFASFSGRVSGKGQELRPRL
jgi:hypothetical protein